MAPLPKWLDKARATSARLITAPDAAGDANTSGTGRKRARSTDYTDIPPFLLPLSVRVKLDKENAKRNSSDYKARARTASYNRDRPGHPHSSSVRLSHLTRSLRS